MELINELMTPAQTMEDGCDLGSWAIMCTARKLITEIVILAVATQRAADGLGSEGCEIDGESTATGCGVGGLSSEGAQKSSGFFVTGVWNVISWVTQLINGLWQCNHEYPRTVVADQSIRVKRNMTRC